MESLEAQFRGNRKRKGNFHMGLRGFGSWPNMEPNMDLGLGKGTWLEK